MSCWSLSCNKIVDTSCHRVWQACSGLGVLCGSTSNLSTGSQCGHLSRCNNAILCCTGALVADEPCTLHVGSGEAGSVAMAYTNTYMKARGTCLECAGSSHDMW